LSFVREAASLWVDAIETSATGRIIGSATDKACAGFKANIHHALSATRQNAGFKQWSGRSVEIKIRQQQSI